MKSVFRYVAAAVVLVAATACGGRERTLVILSTNDMHAKIQRFPQLATAVEACRDTASLVLLVDAGDRWTGNAYVDMAPTPGMPMIGMMNTLGYDVATLGNHEFDHGQAFLGRMLDSMAFEVVCANVVSDTCTFPSLPPYAVVERDGIRIGFVGVVTNYEGPGHPAGHAASFAGLRFPDPQQMALEYAERLRPEVDVLVLLSHMGSSHDRELLARTTSFDVVIGGHSHEEIDETVNGTPLTQTGKNLKNIGVTTVRLRGKKVEGVDFRIVPLERYEPDSSYLRRVDAYYADPRLNTPVGELAGGAGAWGLANWMSGAIAREAKADIGLYHIGGVRLDTLRAGGVSTARIYDLEPFGTRVAVARMTPGQLRRLILAKYNDKINTKEARRIDLVATVPYTILTDTSGEAVDVAFPTLREGRSYKVAMTDYIFLNYKELNYADGEVLDQKVEGILLDELRTGSPLRPDNRPRQAVARR